MVLVVSPRCWGDGPIVIMRDVLADPIKGYLTSHMMIDVNTEREREMPETELDIDTCIKSHYHQMNPEEFWSILNL